MLKRLMFFQAVLMTVILFSFGAPASASYMIYAEADAFVDSYYSTSNYGTYSELYTKKEYYYGTYHYANTYIRFDLSDVPDGATVTGAKLGFWVKYYSNQHTLGAYHVADDSWGETTIKWTNAPAIGTGLLGTTGGLSQNSVEIDLFQNGLWDYRYDLQDNHASFAVMYYSGGWDPRWVRLDSKEGTGGLTHGPYLKLEYTSVPLSPAVWFLASGVMGLLVFRRRKLGR